MGRLTEPYVCINGSTAYHRKGMVNNLQLINKLAHYEDLEEQGRLIELPCKVGEEVWVVHKDYGIEQATYQVARRIVFDMEKGCEFAKTKEEALAKWEKWAELKAELKGETE